MPPDLIAQPLRNTKTPPEMAGFLLRPDDLGLTNDGDASGDDASDGDANDDDASDDDASDDGASDDGASAPASA